MPIDITITEDEARVVSWACRLLSRIHVGDLSDIADIPPLDDEGDRNSLRDHLESLEPLITGKERGKFYNINNGCVSPDARTARDISASVADVLKEQTK